jgi:excisionase family DNA binding protein
VRSRATTRHCRRMKVPAAGWPPTPVKGVRNEPQGKYAHCVADAVGGAGTMRRNPKDTPPQASSTAAHQPTRGHRPPAGPRRSSSTVRIPDDAPAATPTFDELPDVLTVEEAASFLRIGRRQMYQALARGDIYSAKIGRTIRIPKVGILTWLVGPAGSASHEMEDNMPNAASHHVSRVRGAPRRREHRELGEAKPMGAALLKGRQAAMGRTSGA